MNDFNAIGEKPKSNKLWIFVLMIFFILLILAVGVLINNPKFIFNRIIDKMFEYGNVEDYEDMKLNMDIEVDLDGKDKISKFLDEAKLSIGFETSEDSEEQIVLLKLSQENDELIDARAKLDSENQKMYVDLGEFFDKIIEVDTEDTLDEMEADSEPLTFTQMLNAKKATLILKDEVKNQLNEDYIRREEVKVNNKEMTKDTLKLSEKDLSDIIMNIATNLSENENFLECFEEPDEVKKNLDELKENIEAEEFEKNNYIELSIYTKGILKSVEKVDFTTVEDDEKSICEFTKINDEEIEWKLSDDEDELIKGSCSIEKNDDTYNVKIKAKSDGEEITIKTTTKIVYGEEPSKFDTSKSVNIEELSEEDMATLSENFMNSKLYEVIDELVSELFSGITQVDYEDYEDYSYDEDYYSITEDEEIKEVENVNQSVEINKLVSYNDEVIKFNIPNGFKIYSSDSDSYKLFKKEVDDTQINVDVSIDYADMDEFVEEINRTANYFTSDYYSNVKVSEPEDVVINGNTFKKIVLSYDYELFDDEIEKRQEVYFAYKMDDKNLYRVDITNANLMSDEEVKTFLVIEK